MSWKETAIPVALAPPVADSAAEEPEAPKDWKASAVPVKPATDWRAKAIPVQPSAPVTPAAPVGPRNEAEYLAALSRIPGAMQGPTRMVDVVADQQEPARLEAQRLELRQRAAQAAQAGDKSEVERLMEAEGQLRQRISGRIGPTETQESLRRKTIGPGETAAAGGIRSFYDTLAAKPLSAVDAALGAVGVDSRMGSDLSRALEEATPTNPDAEKKFLAGALPQAAGSVAGFMPSGVAGKLVGPLVHGTTVGIGANYEDVRDTDATAAKKTLYTLIGGALGATEAIPIERFMGKLDVPLRETVTQKLLGKLRQKSDQGGLAHTAESVLTQALAEALQEGVQGVGQNTAAQLLGIDPGRNMFDGVSDDVLAALVVGGGMGGMAAPTERANAQDYVRKLDAAFKNVPDASLKASAEKMGFKGDGARSDYIDHIHSTVEKARRAKPKSAEAQPAPSKLAESAESVVINPPQAQAQPATPPAPTGPQAAPDLAVLTDDELAAQAQQSGIPASTLMKGRKAVVEALGEKKPGATWKQSAIPVETTREIRALLAEEKAERESEAPDDLTARLTANGFTAEQIAAMGPEQVAAALGDQAQQQARTAQTEAAQPILPEASSDRQREPSSQTDAVAGPAATPSPTPPAESRVEAASPTIIPPTQETPDVQRQEGPPQAEVLKAGTAPPAVPAAQEVAPDEGTQATPRGGPAMAELYHVTTPDAAASIRRSGFATSIAGELGPGTYLTDNPTELTGPKFQGDRAALRVRGDLNLFELDARRPNPQLTTYETLYGRKEGTRQYEADPKRLDWRHVHRLLRDAGYDGIRAVGVGPKNVVVFDPTGLKIEPGGAIDEGTHRSFLEDRGRLDFAAIRAMPIDGLREHAANIGAVPKGKSKLGLARAVLDRQNELLPEELSRPQKPVEAGTPIENIRRLDAFASERGVSALQNAKDIMESRGGAVDATQYGGGSDTFALHPDDLDGLSAADKARVRQRVLVQEDAAVASREILGDRTYEAAKAEALDLGAGKGSRRRETAETILSDQKQHDPRDVAAARAYLERIGVSSREATEEEPPDFVAEDAAKAGDVRRQSPQGTTQGKIDATDIATELVMAGRASAKELRGRVSNVKPGPIEGNYETLTFALDGVPHKAILKGRNRDLVIGSSPDTDAGIVARAILDGDAVKHSTPKAAEPPNPLATETKKLAAETKPLKPDASTKAGASKVQREAAEGGPETAEQRKERLLREGDRETGMLFTLKGAKDVAGHMNLMFGEPQQVLPQELTVEDEPPAPQPRASEQIADFGEKIGGARKDLAKPTGPRLSREADTRPAWMRKFVVAEDARRPGQWFIGNERGILATRQTFASKEEAERMLPLIAVSQQHRVVEDRPTKVTAPTQADLDASKAADEWLDGVRKDIETAKAGNEGLLLNLAITQRFRQALGKGDITPARYQELVAEGKALNDEDYARAKAVEEKIQGIRDRPLVAAGAKRSATYNIVRDYGGRKRPVIKGGFATRDEAMKYMAEHAVEIIEHKFAFPEKPWLDHIERQGPSRRTGDVTPSQFQEAFGFRGGEFGNWNMGSDGQAALNHAFDALHDLADTIGVPPRALSLNGDLAMAFGARGHGGKDSSRAHYERDYGVINLTKIRGAGSLAHEWFHALDHYLARLEGKATAEREDGKFKATSREGDYATHGFSYNTKARKELVEAFKNVIGTMMVRSVEKPIEAEFETKRLAAQNRHARETLDQLKRDFLTDTSSYRGARYKAATPAQIAEWDRLAEKVLAGDLGESVHIEGRGRFGGRSSRKVIEDMNALYKAVQGRGFSTADPSNRGSHLIWQVDAMKTAEKRLAEANQGVKETKKTATEYFDSARDIDDYRASDYWSTPHEMGARAFESFIFDKMAANERVSDYLAYAVENKYYAALDMKPYPEGQERESINAAFDRLFQTIKTEQSEAGDVKLYSVSLKQEPTDEGPAQQANAQGTSDDPGLPQEGPRDRGLRPGTGPGGISAAQARELATEERVTRYFEDQGATVRRDARNRWRVTYGGGVGFTVQYATPDQLKFDLNNRSHVASLVQHDGGERVTDSLFIPTSVEAFNALSNADKRLIEFGAYIKGSYSPSSKTILLDPNTDIGTLDEEVFHAVMAQSLTEAEHAEALRAFRQPGVQSVEAEERTYQFLRGKSPVPSNLSDAAQRILFAIRSGDVFKAQAAQRTGQEQRFTAGMPSRDRSSFAEIATPSRKALTIEQARDAAMGFVSQPLTNKATGFVATVSRNSLDKMLSESAVGKSASVEAHAMAVANIDQLYAASISGGVAADRAGDQNITAIRRFWAPLIVGNEAVAVKMTVKQFVQPDQGNRIYSLEAVEIETPARIWVDADTRRGEPTSTPHAGVPQILADQIAKFNGDDSPEIASVGFDARRVEQALAAGNLDAAATRSAAQWLTHQGQAVAKPTGALKALVRRFGAGIRRFFRSIWTEFKGILAAAQRNAHGAVGDIGYLRERERRLARALAEQVMLKAAAPTGEAPTRLTTERFDEALDAALADLGITRQDIATHIPRVKLAAAALMSRARKAGGVEAMVEQQPTAEPVKPVRRAVRESVKGPEAAKTVTEPQALKAVMKGQERAARAGYREGLAVARAHAKRAMDKLKAKNADAKAIRAELVKALTSRGVPMRIRAGFIAAVRDTTTTAALGKQLARLDERLAKLEERESARRLREEKRLGRGDADDSLFIEGGGTVPIASIADRASDILRSVRGFFKRNFTSAGDLPIEAFKRDIARRGDVGAAMTRVGFTLADFRRAAKKAYGGATDIPVDEVRKLDAILKGRKPFEDAPDEMRPVLRQMRQELDTLSALMISSGVVEGDLALKIADNMGTYLTRSYRVFDDPKWAKSVPVEVRNIAKAFLRSEYQDRTEAEIDGLIESLLYKVEDSPIALIKSGKLGSKDLSTLTRRKEVPPEIRALWGEHHDPLLNYTRSMTKMANLIASHRFLADVRVAGLGTYFFENPTVKDGQEYKAKIAADGSSAMAPLNGLYTTPEIKKAFEEATTQEPLPRWLEHYMKGMGAVKYAKTVGSMMTHVRNLIGNTGFAVAQGHWRVTKAADALGGVATKLLKLSSNEYRAYVEHLQKLGVVGEGARAGELRDVLQDAMGKDINEFAGVSAVRRSKNILKPLTALYAAEDDVWKIYAFENEVARYSKALPDESKEAIEERAAETVRNTYPTYSLIPRAVKWVRRFPLVGTFVSFPAEVFRTGKNTLGLIAKELADPKLRGIGAQRLVGTMLAATSTYAMAAATRAMMGMTSDDDEEVKEFLPPWSRHSDIAYLGNDGDGSIRYVDMSYTDPYSYLKQPIQALMRGEDWQQSLVDATAAAMEPFFGEDILASKLMDISRNTTEDGRRIYNPQASSDKIALDIVGHVANAFEPGTVTSMRRVWSGIANRTNLYGKSYDPKIEAIATVTGVRMSNLDVKQAVSYKAYDFARNLSDATQILTSVLNRRGTVTEDEVHKAYTDLQESRGRIFDEAHRAALAAMRLGVSDRDVLIALRSSNVSAANAQAIIRGETPLYAPSDGFGPDLAERVGVEEARKRINAMTAARRSAIQTAKADGD